MIRFSDIGKAESYSEQKDTKSFKDIRPLNECCEDPHDYWDNVFSLEQDIAKVTDDELAAQIFDRHPDEFTFDFSFDDEVNKALAQFDSDEWSRLAVKERLSEVQKFVDVLGEKLGLENTPKVVCFDGPDNMLGAYVQGKNKIEINSILLSNPQSLVKTLAHETRHAYQYERSLIMENWDDFLYKVNFDNYVRPGKDEHGFYHSFEEYEDQLVEAEARAFSNLFRSKGAE